MPVNSLSLKKEWKLQMIKKARQQKKADGQGDFGQKQHIQHEEKATLRLNKYISDSGHCSRREADRLIEAGRVKVDGVLAPIGLKVVPGQEVSVDDKVVRVREQKVYIALNKPAGITCTTDQSIEGNLTDFMNYREKIFPIGRLDKDSTGLLLMTSDGDIVNKILRVENGHDKEYQVMVDKKFNQRFLDKMTSGVEIYNPVADRMEVTKPCEIEAIGAKSFNLTLQQGLNRQIRRMCEALGYNVVTLKRRRIMSVHLANLAEGQWRYLTSDELAQIEQAINKNS